MLDAFSLIVPTDPSFESLAPELATRYAELAGGSAADAQAAGAALRRGAGARVRRRRARRARRTSRSGRRPAACTSI